jgi:hypothetical protein
MRSPYLFLLVLVLSASACVDAEPIVVRNDEHLASDRPEAWAMKYFAGATLMSGFGQTPALPAGGWVVAAELGHIPRLSEAQQRVGFSGFKSEDLNKTPVFGRMRLMAGLPGGFVAELAYTPPLSLNGAKPRDLVAMAIGRRLFERGPYTLSLRAFAQSGRIVGDITCPGAIAGIANIERNPYGCQAPSADQFTLRYYGAELTSGWNSGDWHVHAGVGAVRTELSVQVNALTFDASDRSRLVARGLMPFVTVGGSRDLDAHWRAGLEVLYVPLDVRRGVDAPRESDPLTSVRLQLRYQID